MKRGKWSEARQSVNGATGEPLKGSFVRTRSMQDVPVDIVGIDNHYRTFSLPASVEFTQWYTGNARNLKPAQMRWDVETQGSELLQRHAEDQFQLTFHIGDRTFSGVACLTWVKEEPFQFTGRSELEGLFECGLCVPEVQNEPG